MEELELLPCPHYDDDPGQRCGLPSEVVNRGVMRSTDGPLESASIQCVLGHVFSGPLEYLIF